MAGKTTTERTYQGIGVSPGVARGKILVYSIAEEVVPEYDITAEQVPQEIARFEQALITTREQLKELQERIATGIGSTAPSSILDVHLSITEDPALIEPVMARLDQQRKNVEYIFNEATKKYAKTLAEIPDEFLRERVVDVQDVSRRIMRNLLGHEHRLLTNLPPDTIVVAHDLSPSDTSSLDRQHVIGFATDVGSHTSHTTIMARSMNLPAVVGLRDVSKHVHDGQLAILDGYSGTLIIEPSQQTLFVYGQLEVKRHTVEERLATLRDLPAQTLDGHRVVVSGNIELPEDVPALHRVGAEGIGLFRTEFLYLNRKDFPSEQEQYEKYLQVARSVKPHSAIIRTLDIGGDKFRTEDTTPPEINPFLGFRAIRFCLAHVDIFEAQLRAILRASAEGNVKIMYPMISGVAEVVQANEILQQVMFDLKKEGVPFDENIQIASIFMWSMENEEAIQGTVMGTRILETIVATTHKIDPSRKVTAAMNHARNDGGYADVLDVVGYNYGDKQLAYVKDHEKYPDRVIFCTEGTSFVSTRGEYETNWDKGYTSNTIIVKPDWGPYPGEDWADIVKYPFLGGLFVWSGFDYRGEPTPFSWPCVSSHFGIMDICGFPKDGYYAYKAAWTNEPVVHIFPHWNWPGKEGDSIKVHCYTNCDEVELFLNGKSVGKQKSVPFTKLIWGLVYKPGKLEARGYKGGKLITNNIVETTSAPSQVTLNSDVNTLKADGCDVALIRVAIKDEKGRVVPTTNNLVKFSIEGPGRIIGTGNGNPTSYEPDKASQRMAFNGYCLVLIQSGKQAGEIILKAVSENLKEAEVAIKTE